MGRVYFSHRGSATTALEDLCVAEDLFGVWVGEFGPDDYQCRRLALSHSAAGHSRSVALRHSVDCPSELTT